MVDHHVHIGRYSNGLFFDPVQTARELIILGVDRWVVSSTTMSLGCDFFDEALLEHLAMENEAPNQSIHALWVSPQMLDAIDQWFLPMFKLFKIHEKANAWTDTELECAAELAADRSIPILIHTGGTDRYDAGSYEWLCRKHPKTTFILAHGRPIDQAVRVLQNTENTLVDTAFMPIEDILLLIENGLSDRILFGSDYPLDRLFYPEESAIQRYKTRLMEIQTVIPQILRNTCILTKTSL